MRDDLLKIVAFLLLGLTTVVVFWCNKVSVTQGGSAGIPAAAQISAR